MLNAELVLSNGVKVPQLGLGTWFIDDSVVADAVQAALDMGYRHIDTAQAYGNERGVGEGVHKSGKARNEIFIQNKVAAECKSYESALASIDSSLERMGLDYIDLMIIHSPQPWIEVNQSDNRYYDENKEVWRALEDALEQGKVRAIGVSNFQIDDLKNLLDGCRVKPMVNQVLAHISNTPLELLEYCNAQGIVAEAYSPIGHGAILSNPKIKEVADKYKVSVPQLCIRYVLQLGMVALPKASTAAHMQQNASLDFEISAEDIEELKRFDRIEDYGDARIFPVYGGKL